LPDDALLLVLLLLEHEHVMIEELLQLLIGEVDAELLEAVVLHLFMHHDAHRHTAKRQREKESERKNSEENGTKTCAVRHHPCPDG